MALLPDESRVSDARAAGARGILLRDSEAPVLAAALVAVAQGLVVMEQELAAGFTMLVSATTMSSPFRT